MWPDSSLLKNDRRICSSFRTNRITNSIVRSIWFAVQLIGDTWKNRWTLGAFGRHVCCDLAINYDSRTDGGRKLKRGISTEYEIQSRVQLRSYAFLIPRSPLCVYTGEVVCTRYASDFSAFRLISMPRTLRSYRIVAPLLRNDVIHNARQARNIWKIWESKRKYICTDQARYNRAWCDIYGNHVRSTRNSASKR